MLYFDPEKRNIRDVKKLGVTAIWVPDTGLTMNLLTEGFAQYSKIHAKKQP